MPRRLFAMATNPPSPSEMITPTADTPAAVVAPPLVTPSFSPLYQQIKSLILNSLQEREWQPGEAIPS